MTLPSCPSSSRCLSVRVFNLFFILFVAALTHPRVHITGGVKDSGFGAFNGKEGLRGFSYRKAIVTVRTHQRTHCAPLLCSTILMHLALDPLQDRLGVRAAAPGWLQYPVSSSAKTIVQNAMFMVYGRSWAESVRGCINMLSAVASAPSKPEKPQDKKE